jgi:NAD(P)-dependent dehydrogenase (short-subunit alcohol dehydrogenase family)
MIIKRQALVTGANKGIGLAIARGLAEAGFFVWIGARDRARGEQAVAHLRDAGLDAGLLELDVAVEESVKRAAATLSEQIGCARYPGQQRRHCNRYDQGAK